MEIDARLARMGDGMVVAAEQHTDTPQSAQRHHYIDNTADNPGLSTTDPGHEVKLEKAHKAPVEAADNQQRQSDFIQHIFSLLWPVGALNFCGKLRLSPFFPQKRKIYEVRYWKGKRLPIDPVLYKSEQPFKSNREFS